MASLHRTYALIAASMLFCVAGCAEQNATEEGPVGPYPNNPYAQWRATVELPEEAPVLEFPASGTCEDAKGDTEILKCAEAHFWRVFQRDIDDRQTFWNAMNSLEERLSDNVDSVAKARFLFQRGQLAMSYALEQTELTPESMRNMTSEQLTLLSSMSSDMEDAIALDPNEPFYVIWLDTIKIATADRLHQKENMAKAVDEAFVNVEKWNDHTTRSALIASLSGTTVGLSLASGAPERTMALLETFECHPKRLMENPDAICGVGADQKDCLRWCLSNSSKAPFAGPGFMYHIGESYARMGDVEEAQRLYELALTLPGADQWPHRWVVDNALADMDAHVGKFTDLKDDETASFAVYANSQFACRFCHGTPAE